MRTASALTSCSPRNGRAARADWLNALFPESPVPVIDLAADAPDELLDAVREAIETVGVVQVLGHGIPGRLIGEFDQRIRQIAGPSRKRMAELAGAVRLAEEHVSHHGLDAIWAGNDPELRDLTFRYITAGQSVCERVLALYARAQRLPEGVFPAGSLPYLGFTLNNYPTWTYPDTGSGEDRLLLIESAESSAVTVLAMGGDREELRVQLPGGDWLPVPIVAGALQIFSGALLTRWTNGRLRTAAYRIVPEGTGPRRSVAIFYYQGFHQLPQLPFAELATPLRTATAAPPRTAA